MRKKRTPADPGLGRAGILNYDENEDEDDEESKPVPTRTPLLSSNINARQPTPSVKTRACTDTSFETDDIWSLYRWFVKTRVYTDTSFENWQHIPKIKKSACLLSQKSSDSSILPLEISFF